MKKSLFLCLLFLCVWGTAWADISKTWTSDGTNFSPWRPYGSLPSGMTCTGTEGRAYSLYEVEYVVSVASAGNVVVGLQYSSGIHALRTLGVDLIGSDGTVRYKSYNEVNVGSDYQSNYYNYTLSSVAAGTYILRIIVCHESKSNNLANTNGKIKVTGADEVITAGDIYTAYNSIASSTTYVSDTYVGAYTTAVQTALANAASAYNTAQQPDLTALQDAHRTRQGGPNNRTVLANGEIFQIKCTDATYNRGYIAYYADGNNEENVSLAGAVFSGQTYPAIDAANVYSGWSVYYYDSKYYLYNAHNGKFVKVVVDGNDRIVKYTENLTEAATIVLLNTSGSVTEWNLKIYGTSNYLSASVSRGNASGAVRTDTNNNDAGAKFNLIKVTGASGNISTVEDDTRNAIARKILLPALSAMTPKLGSSTGQYTYTGSNEATDVANINTARNYIDGTVTPTEGQLEAAITNMTGITSSLTLNQPTPGKLYRFKGKASGKYMKSNGAGSQMTVSTDLNDNGPATIFMLIGGNKLLSYDLGLYANNTHSIGSAVGNFNTYSFLKSEGGNVGYYTIKSNYSGGGQYLWSNATETNRNREYAEGNCDWEIEEVTWLPVPIYNDDYKLGTFYSPVPLKRYYNDNERIKFYTGTVTKNYFNLTEYTDNVIPANTAFVTEFVGGEQDIKENCSYLQIASAPTLTEDQRQQLANNQLAGQFETIDKSSIPGINDKTIYTMQVIQVNNDSKLMFARYTGSTMKGFRAYLPVDNSTIEAGLASFRLVFGVPTGIDTIGNQPAQEQTVYDLSGRRVEHAGKGLYIVNGKKVMIK